MTLHDKKRIVLGSVVAVSVALGVAGLSFTVRQVTHSSGHPNNTIQMDPRAAVTNSSG